MGHLSVKVKKSQYGLMGGLSSDQSERYLGHGLVSKFPHKLHGDQREKYLRQ